MFLRSHDSRSREELLLAFKTAFRPKDGTPVLTGNLDRAANWRAFCKQQQFYNHEKTFKHMHNNKWRKFLFQRGQTKKGVANVSCQVKTADDPKMAFV
jgi:hypothetical protein